MTTTQTDMTIATEIKRQLGDARFAMMTGAHTFVGGERFLLFALKRGAKDGINKVRITLDPSDTYTVEFFRIRGVNVTTVSKVSDVYCDQLQAVFTRATGLYTRF